MKAHRDHLDGVTGRCVSLDMATVSYILPCGVR